MYFKEYGYHVNRPKVKIFPRENSYTIFKKKTPNFAFWVLEKGCGNWAFAANCMPLAHILP